MLKKDDEERKAKQKLVIKDSVELQHKKRAYIMKKKQGLS